jgi:hypothetical protein
MDATRWQRLSALLDEALDLPSDARAPWLAALTDSGAIDAPLAEQLARMLAAEPASPGAFDALLQQALQHQDAPLDESPDLAGRRMGAWALLRKIGEGGMGQVWLARRADGLYEQEVVVKLLRGDLQQASLSERFARERAVLARLHHPGIAKLLDAGVEAGLPFLVLEYVMGSTLTEHAQAECPTVAARVTLLIRVAQAVAHAHAQLVVHRDLKPSNIMVSLEGHPKVLDFGIAGLLDDEAPGQLTRLAGRGLTLGYAAPEQLSGEPIGVAADVFALGVLLFELLSGRLPFVAEGKSRAAAEHALLHEDAPRLSQLPAASGAGRPADFARVRGDLEAVVAKALRKDPAERYAGVAGLVDDLRLWLAHRPVAARREDWRHRSRLWLRRNALPAGLGATLAVAVLAGLAVSLTQWQRAGAAAHQSDQVTLYLTDLLGSASPDKHGGESPNVLQLLEKSRQELDDKFKHEPATKARLLEVLAKTYEGLSRYDLAGPLAEQWIALSAQAYGEDDPRTVNARLKLAQIYTPNGPWDGVIAQLEPLRPRIAKLYGSESETMRELLAVLANSQIKTGRLQAAAQTLHVLGELTGRLYPPGSFERAFHHNFVSVLYVSGGRLSDALAELRKTEAAQAQASTENLRHALALRRNTWAVQIRLADYDQIEARMLGLAAEMDHLHGVGSATRASLYVDMARYHADRGEFALALADRAAFLAGHSDTPQQAQAASLAALLLARTLANAAPAAELAAAAQALLATVAADGRQLGALRRAEAWLALARCGLLLDDLPLAAAAIQRLRSDAELHLTDDLWLNSRVAQAEGELLRARADWPGSAKLLAQRVALLDSSPDKAVPAIWQARLDLATSLVLMHDPGAAAALALAAAARPPQMPAKHPLDAVQHYLEQVVRGGDERAARRAVEQAYGRDTAAGAALPHGLGGIF